MALKKLITVRFFFSFFAYASWGEKHEKEREGGERGRRVETVVSALADGPMDHPSLDVPLGFASLVTPLAGSSEYNLSRYANRDDLSKLKGAPR